MHELGLSQWKGRLDYDWMIASYDHLSERTSVYNLRLLVNKAEPHS